MNILDPIFYRTWFLKFSLVNPPSCGPVDWDVRYSPWTAHSFLRHVQSLVLLALAPDVNRVSPHQYFLPPIPTP